MDFLFVSSKNSIFDIPWALQRMPEHTVSILDSTAFDPNLSDDNQNKLLLKQLTENTYECHPPLR